ncbi:MAG: BspA family leucine-rich repeat surface protein [Defluviitaleaceae bacterium]|nr:BspA family leucine-rich repeat surface protein [Defluviitaleaceae bacterium]
MKSKMSKLLALALVAVLAFNVLLINTHAMYDSNGADYTASEQSIMEAYDSYSESDISEIDYPYSESDITEIDDPYSERDINEIDDPYSEDNVVEVENTNEHEASLNDEPEEIADADEEDVLTNIFTFVFPEDAYGYDVHFVEGNDGAFCLLYGVIAIDMHGNEMNVFVIDDGGFDIHAQFPDNVFIVVYGAECLVTGVVQTVSRVIVVTMAVTALNDFVSFFGTATWSFNNNMLYIHEGTITTHWSIWCDSMPWYDIRHDIYEVVIDGPVVIIDAGNGLFANLPNVTSFVGMENIDVSGAGHLMDFFAGASSLVLLDVPSWGWDFSNVFRVDRMFYGVSSLEFLDLSDWDTSYMDSMGGMFENASSLHTLIAPRLIIEHRIYGTTPTFPWMFYNANSLVNLDVSEWQVSGGSFDGFISVFENASSLTALDLSSWVTTDIRMPIQAFANMTELRSLNLSTWDMRNIEDFYVDSWISDMFYNLPNLREFILGQYFSFPEYIEFEWGSGPSPSNHNFATVPLNNETYTGYWTYIDPATNQQSARQFTYQQLIDYQNATNQVNHWVWQTHMPPAPIVIDVEEDRETTVSNPPSGGYTIYGDDPNDIGNIYVTFPPGTPPGNIEVNLPTDDNGETLPGWSYIIPPVADGEDVVVIITPPENETPWEGPVIIDIEEDRETTVSNPPDGGYTIEGDGSNDTGNIYVTFPPGTPPSDIVVNHPDDWTYEITTDEDGNVVVIITPPANGGNQPGDDFIIIDVEEDRETIVSNPPDGGYTIEGDDPNDTGNIYVTFPPGTPPGDIIVNHPDDWTYEITTDEDGNVVVIITPPAGGGNNNENNNSGNNNNENNDNENNNNENNNNGNNNSGSNNNINNSNVSNNNGSNNVNNNENNNNSESTDDPIYEAPTDNTNVIGNDNVENDDYVSPPQQGSDSSNVPPLPSIPGNQIIQDGNRWIELDEMGIPFGEWRWDDEADMWIFTAFAPPSLSAAVGTMPQTGVTHSNMFYVMGLLISIIAAGGLYVLQRKLKQKA